MRLLIFNLATDIDDPILGFTTHWIGALARRVEFIHVITMRAGRLDVADNVRVHSAGKEKGYSEARRVVEFYRILWRVLRHERIDACFSHMIPLFTMMAAPLLKARRIPLVTWYAHPSVTWILKTAHKLSDRVVASVSSAYPYKHDKLTPIGHGIAVDLFSPGPGAARVDPPVILCVGRLSPVKDHPTLLNAISLLRHKYSAPFRAVILGCPATANDAIYAESLRRRVKELALDDIVSFEPAVPIRELPAWYRRCTVHVNMSPLGFGDKVAWEAMACAKPCMVANEGFRETLGRHQSELLYRHGNAEDLAERLRWLFGLPQPERDAIGAYLREQVIVSHCVDGLARRLVKIFESLKRRPVGAAPREITESR
jgi:glycosyltransferase involved in cell wall biosynthesis